MSTIVINVDDKSSAKLFLDLAKKLHFKASVLTEEQREDMALWSMMKDRENEPTVPVEKALEILRKKSK